MWLGKFKVSGLSSKFKSKSKKKPINYHQITNSNNLKPQTRKGSKQFVQSNCPLEGTLGVFLGDTNCTNHFRRFDCAQRDTSDF